MGRLGMLRGCLIVFCVLFVLSRHSFGIMNHKHEREGIVTLTKDSIISVESVSIQEEYRVRLDLVAFILG